MLSAIFTKDVTKDDVENTLFMSKRVIQMSRQMKCIMSDVTLNLYHIERILIALDYVQIYQKIFIYFPVNLPQLASNRSHIKSERQTTRSKQPTRSLYKFCTFELR